MTIRAIISRAEAKARGLKRYFTGIPCLRGHVDERLTGCGHCVVCNLVKSTRIGKTPAGRLALKGRVIKWRASIDHKTPLSRGGSNWPGNIQLLCLPCNDSKGTKTMDEWITWRAA